MSMESRLIRVNRVLAAPHTWRVGMNPTIIHTCHVFGPSQDQQNHFSDRNVISRELADVSGSSAGAA
jgi:hypothetical protein